MEIDNREIDFVKWNKTQFFLPADDVTPCKNKGYLLVCSMHCQEKLRFPTLTNLYKSTLTIICCYIHNIRDSVKEST